MSPVQTAENNKEPQANSLVDLDEFIEFIDPERINDSRFLAILIKYRTEHMSLEEYVEWVEANYEKIIKKNGSIGKIKFYFQQ